VVVEELEVVAGLTYSEVVVVVDKLVVLPTGPA